MSFVTFKRQLSADLERFSSRKKTANRRKSTPTSSVRLLGNISRTPKNPQNFSRCCKRNVALPSQDCHRFFENSTHCNTDSSCGVSKQTGRTASARFPRTPPPSRQDVRNPSLHCRKCDWTTKTDDKVPKIYVEENYSENSSSSNSSVLLETRLPGRRNTSDSLPGRDNTPNFLPGRRNMPDFAPGQRNVLDHEIPMDDSPLGNLPLGTLPYKASGLLRREFSPLASEREERPVVKLVVTVPKNDVKSAVLFPYKHGKMRIAF